MRLVIIAHDIRSAHNVGSLARSADAFGVKTIYCTGYTPYISSTPDNRLPHLRNKMIANIHKTALNAENQVDIVHEGDVLSLISRLRSDGFIIAGLEQDPSSLPIKRITDTSNMAIILGNETEGVSKQLLSLCDKIFEIPMFGRKESLNVSVAGAIAMYELFRT